MSLTNYQEVRALQQQIVIFNEHSSEAAEGEDNKDEMSKGGREGGGSDSNCPMGVCVLNNHPSMKLFVFSPPSLPLLASNGRKHKEWPRMK